MWICSAGEFAGLDSRDSQIETPKFSTDANPGDFLGAPLPLNLAYSCSGLAYILYYSH